MRIALPLLVSLTALACAEPMADHDPLVPGDRTPADGAAHEGSTHEKDDPAAVDRSPCDLVVESLRGSEDLASIVGCTVVARAEASDATGTRAAILAMQHEDVDVPHYLVTGDASSWRRYVHLFDVYDGVSGSERMSVARLEIGDFIEGGAAEIVIETDSFIETSSCTEPVGWETKRVDVTLCAFDDRGEPFCRGRLPRAFHEVEVVWNDEGDRARTRVLRRFTLDVAFEDGAIVTRRVSGRVPREVRALLGAHAIADLPDARRMSPFF